MTAPPPPINPVVIIQPLTTTAIVPDATSQNPILLQAKHGDVLEGFVINRDAQQNPILRTSQGDILLKSEVFLRTGAQVQIRVDAQLASRARIVLIDGQSPEIYAKQTQSAPKRTDAILPSSVLGTQTLSASAQLGSTHASAMTLAAIVLRSAQMPEQKNTSAPSSSRQASANIPANAPPDETLFFTAQPALKPGNLVQVTLLSSTLPTSPAPAMPVIDEAVMPPAAAITGEEEAPAAPQRTSAASLTAVAEDGAAQIASKPAAPAPVNAQNAQMPTSQALQAKVSSPATNPQMLTTQTSVQTSVQPAAQTSGQAIITPQISTQPVISSNTVTQQTAEVTDTLPTPLTQSASQPARESVQPQTVNTQIVKPSGESVETDAPPQASSPLHRPVTAGANPAPAAAPSASTPRAQPTQTDALWLAQAAQKPVPNASPPANMSNTSGVKDSAFTAQLLGTNAPARQQPTMQPAMQGYRSHLPANALLNQPVTSAPLPPTTSVNSGAQSLVMEVIGHEQDGATIVKNADTSLKLFTANPLPLGAKLQLHIRSVLPEASAGGAVLPSRLVEFSQFFTHWETLSALAETLSPEMSAAMNPAPAGGMLTSLMPQIGPRLTHEMMLWMNALGRGSLREILPPKMLQKIERVQPELLQRLNADTQSLSQFAQISPQSPWAFYAIPLLMGEQLHHLRLYVRSDEEKSGANSGETTHNQRFIMEVSLSHLSDLQLDGFVQGGEKPKQFDLVIRSERELAEDITSDIQRLFQSALGATRLRGSIHFQTGREFFVNMQKLAHPEALSPAAGDYTLLA